MSEGLIAVDAGRHERVVAAGSSEDADNRGSECLRLDVRRQWRVPARFAPRQVTGLAFGHPREQVSPWVLRVHSSEHVDAGVTGRSQCAAL